MNFMWQYYVTKDTKLSRQWKHSFNGLCSPTDIIQINQSDKTSLIIHYNNNISVNQWFLINESNNQLMNHTINL